MFIKSKKGLDLYSDNNKQIEIMNSIEILKMLDESVYANLSLNYNSEGKIMTKKELKPRMKMIKNLILNFTIEALKQKEVPYTEFQQAKDLMI